jgi:hypothetical protein
LVFTVPINILDADCGARVQTVTVACWSDDRGGVVLSSTVSVIPAVYKDPSDSRWFRRMWIDPEAGFLQLAATRFTPEWQPLAMLLPQAIATPTLQATVEYPERQLTASLLEARLSIGGIIVKHSLSLIVGVWAVLLANRWRVVLWPRPSSACIHCSYNRTGIAKSAVCPECGKAP